MKHPSKDYKQKKRKLVSVIAAKNWSIQDSKKRAGNVVEFWLAYKSWKQDYFGSSIRLRRYLNTITEKSIIKPYSPIPRDTRIVTVCSVGVITPRG